MQYDFLIALPESVSKSGEKDLTRKQQCRDQIFVHIKKQTKKKQQQQQPSEVMTAIRLWMPGMGWVHFRSCSLTGLVQQQRWFGHEQGNRFAFSAPETQITCGLVWD